MTESDDEAVLVEDSKERLTKGSERVNSLWYNDPNPVAPKQVKDALVVMLGMDVPLGVLAWSVLGHKAIGSLSLIRAVMHAHTHRLATLSSKTRWATGTFALVSSLQWIVLRWFKRRFKRTDWFGWLCAILGPIQFATFLLTHPETLMGSAIRFAWFLLSTGFPRLAKKLRLEGTLIVPKARFPRDSATISKEWVAMQVESHPTLVRHLPFRLSSVQVATVTGDAPKAGALDSGTYVVKLEYQGEANDNPMLPKSLVVKNAPVRLASFAKKRYLGAPLREVRFFKEIAPTIYDGWNASAGMLLQVPRTFAVEYDDLSSDFILLCEAPFVAGSPTDAASWQQACSVAVRYARFHSIFWHGSLEDMQQVRGQSWERSFNWMAVNQDLFDSIVNTSFESMMQSDALATLVNSKMQRLLRLFFSNLPAVLQALQQGPLTLIHGGCRLENTSWPSDLFKETHLCGRHLAFDDTYERRGVKWLSYNWEYCSIAPGVIDLAQFVALSLQVDPVAGDACDRTLVTKYYEQLASCLGESLDSEEYGFDQCWRDYKFGLLIATLFPVAECVFFSDSATKSDGQTFQRRRAMLQRAMQALERVDAQRALEDLLANTLTVRQMGGQLTPYRLVEDLMLSVEDDSEEEDSPVILRSVTPKDEKFGHITPQSLKEMPLPQDAFDRWFLNGYNGETMFAASLAVYPGRNLMDAAFSVVLDGEQHNFRACRALSPKEWPCHESEQSVASTTTFIPESQVGPISIHVLEPLKAVQLDVNVPGYIKASLTFREQYAPSMQPPYQRKIEGIGSFNFDRLVQFVVWDGYIEIRGKRIAVQRWHGSRDRAWGSRPHPTADASNLVNRVRFDLAASKFLRENLLNPLLRTNAPQLYWFSCLLHFQHGCIAYHSQQDQTGKVVNGAAQLFGDPFLSTPVSSSATSNDDNAFNNPFLPKPGRTSGSAHAPYGRCEAAGHSVQYIPGTRHAKSCTVVLALQDGRRITLACELAGLPFFMSGVGYLDPQWGHGADHLHTDRHGCGLVFQVDTLRTYMQDRNRAENWHVQELVNVVARLFEAQAAPDQEPVATSEGLGCVEQLVIGPHAPSLFSTLYDVA